METIPHRELRNDSSRILARVSAGESIGVTNNGRLAAILTPPATSELERVRQSGSVRPARRPRQRFDAIDRVRLDASTAELLDDVRGDR
ncbi:MAG: type II toxin-antitoxin system Phd/YefM family antitoxin [Nocardioides sp.]